EVVDVDREVARPVELVWSSKPGTGGLSNSEVIIGVAAPRGWRGTAGLESLGRVLPDRLQHPVPTGPAVLAQPNQELINESRHDLEGASRLEGSRWKHRFRSGEVTAADKDREPI